MKQVQWNIANDSIKTKIQKLQEEIHTTFYLDNARIATLLEYTRSLILDKNINTDDLESFDKNIYGSLLRRLIHEKFEEIEGKELLLELFKNIAELNIKLGDCTQELKYYTDSAVACQYILSIVNKYFAKLEDIKIFNLKKEVYSLLTSIFNKIVKSASSDFKDDLIDINEETVSEFSNKKLLEQLRSETSIHLKIMEYLEGPDYVNCGRIAFEHIADQMQNYLKKMFEDAEKILVKPQDNCNYTVVGLGSMALQQITPYSDLEFAILTEDDKYKNNKDSRIKNYYKNLSHLVHFKVICLGETIIPTSKYNIDMSDFVNQAVNFDLGGKTTLGRIDGDKPYDLIQTIDGMMRYVINKEKKPELKGGEAEHIDKNLHSILEKVTFVHGNHGLFNKYQSRLEVFMKAQSEEYPSLSNCQYRALKGLVEGVTEIDYLNTGKYKHIAGNLEQFQVNLEDSVGYLFNVKQEIYRLPDRFIYNFGKLFDIQGSSAWDTLEKLEKSGIICKGGADNLKEAVTFATSLRAKTYDYYNCQKEKLSLKKNSKISHLEESQKIFGFEEDIKIDGNLFKFFYIMISLHQKLTEYCKPYDIGAFTTQKEHFLKEKFYQDDLSTKAKICTRLLQWDKALKIYKEIKEQFGEENLEEEIIILNKIGTIHGLNSKHLKSLKYYERALQKETKLPNGKSLIHLTILKNIGDTYVNLDDCNTALKFYLHILETRELIDHKNKVVTDILNSISNIYSHMGEYKIALQYLIINGTLLDNEGEDTATNLNNIGNQYYRLGRYETALHYQDQALKMRENLLTSDHPDITSNKRDIDYTLSALYDSQSTLHTQQQISTTKKLSGDGYLTTELEKFELHLILSLKNKYKSLKDEQIKSKIDNNINVYIDKINKVEQLHDSNVCEPTIEENVREVTSESKKQQSISDSINRCSNFFQIIPNKINYEKIFQFIEELNDITNELSSQEKTLLYLKTDVIFNNTISSDKFEIFWKLRELLASNNSQVTKELQIEIKGIQKKYSQLNNSSNWMSLTSDREKTQFIISQNLLDLLIGFYENEQVKTQETLEIQIKNIHQFLDSTEKISFEPIDKEQTPILHYLCEAYQQTELDLLLELLKVILQKGANIGVQDIYGNTILHNISWYKCDKKLLDCINGYIQKRDYNQLNLDSKCPLEMAIENNNFQLIEFLKDKTDIKEYGKELLIVATKYGNIKLVKDLISEHNVDCNIQDDTGRPIIHYAIFQRSLDNETSNEQYRKIIKLLIKNGAEVSHFYDQYSHKQEVPLLWALENKDIELALLLIENSNTVSYSNKDQNCPIHLAILNLKDCPLQQKPDYLKLIKKIAEKAMINGDGLNQEYRGGSETSLYLAAQQEDIEVMEILLKSGVDVNYKNHRFISQVLGKVKNPEVIKLFIESGLRIDAKECVESIDYRQNSCSNALKELEEINADQYELNKLKKIVEKIYNKVNYYIDYIDFYKINTIEGIKKQIRKIKESLLKQKPEILEPIKTYLYNYAELFKLYSNNSIKDLKKLVLEKIINLKVVDVDGKDLFCHALEKQDFSFISWLADNNGININVRFSDPCKANPNRETGYYRHLSKHADGKILEVLNSNKLINWEEFDDYEVSAITRRAKKTNDLKVIQLFQSYKPKYTDILLFSSYSGSIDPAKHSTNHNKELLEDAIIYDDVGLIKCLIEKTGVDVNTKFHGDTLLDSAIKRKSKKILKYLIENTAQPGEEFYISEVLELDLNTQKLLLKYIRDNQVILKQVLNEAIHHLDNVNVIKIVLDLGWKPDTYDDSGYTALHKCAAYKGYNDTLKFLCENSKVTLEAPVANFIIYATSGKHTAVGWALEHDNFEGAKILIENGASPFKYFGILLIDALRKKDIEYFKLLLKNSITINQEEVNIYLNQWIKDSITSNEIYKSFQNLHEIQSIVDIKGTLPDDIYLFIFTEAIKCLPEISVADDQKILLVSTEFKKMSDKQKDLVLLKSISIGNKFIKSENYIDALAIFESIDDLFLIEKVSLQNHIILNVAKCYLHLNNLGKASQIVNYLSSSNYHSEELLLIKKKIALEYNKLYPDPPFIPLSLPYTWDFDINGKLPSDNDNPCLAPRDTSSLSGEIIEENTDYF